MINTITTFFLNVLRKIHIYSLINMVGIIVGLTCFMLVVLFVKYENSYDSFHEKSDRIYRIGIDYFEFEGEPELHFAAMPPAAAPLLKQDFSQIIEIARIGRCGNGNVGALISNDNVAYYEPGFATADNEIFKIFDFQWLQGNPDTALINPYSVVLTASLATKYFGEELALGKTLYIEGINPVEVTGVIEDLPRNTNLNFTMLVSILYGEALEGDYFLQQWELECFHTYALFTENSNIEDFQAESKNFYARYIEEIYIDYTDYSVHSIKDIHLRSNRIGEMKSPGSIEVVQTFSVVGFLILLISCFNYINLSTARAINRALEVGIKKAIGCTQRQLVVEFLFESIVMVTIAMFMAIVLLQIILPVVNAYLNLEMRFDYFLNIDGLIIIFSIIFFVGVVAGSYPAFYLSSFKPARVLSGVLSQGKTSIWLRKLLVILQFSISISLIISTIITYQQMNYIRNIELGFEKDQIVVMTSSPTKGLGSQWDIMKQQLLSKTEILEVTASQFTPGTSVSNTTNVTIPGGAFDSISMRTRLIYFDFFETYDIDLMAGRSFDEDFGADFFSSSQEVSSNQSFIINELAAKQLNYSPEGIIGLQINAIGTSGTIIGVVKNIYWESVHNTLQPVIYIIVPINRASTFQTIREASLRVSSENLQETLAFIDATWAQFLPDQPITRHFLSQDFEEIYQAEQRQAMLILCYSVLAVFIAIIGLFGLSQFTTDKRSKEIGVRKVLGASRWSIICLFSNEFSILVLISNIIAWPITFYLMQLWLQTFIYHIDIKITVFLVSSFLTFIIAWVTVAAVVAKVSSSNIINSLRYE